MLPVKFLSYTYHRAILSEVYSLRHNKMMLYSKKDPYTVVITDLCNDCNSNLESELTVHCDYCSKKVHQSCSGMLPLYQFNLLIVHVGLDHTVHREWTSCPTLCRECREKHGITQQKLFTASSDEYYSALLAYNTKHVVLVLIDKANRVFPLIYRWLDTESQVHICVIQ